MATGVGLVLNPSPNPSPSPNPDPSQVGTWRGWGVVKAGDERTVPLSEASVIERQREQGSTTFQFPGVGGRSPLRLGQVRPIPNPNPDPNSARCDLTLTLPNSARCDLTLTLTLALTRPGAT